MESLKNSIWIQVVQSESLNSQQKLNPLQYKIH